MKDVTSAPISSLDEIAKVRDFLALRPRDLLLFDMATQTGLKMKDILLLKVYQVHALGIGDCIVFQNSKGRRVTSDKITETLFQTIKYFLSERNPKADEFLFKSRKGDYPLRLSTVTNLIKGWFDTLELKGLTGARSLHKTWQVHYRISASQKPDNKPFTPAGKVLNPVKSKTLQEVVYKELFQAIISGKLSPGQRLTIESIADQIKVSPMPVRDALGRLEEAGFLTFQKKRGVVINELSLENLEEILRVRLVLECMAAEKAAIVCSEETISRLTDLHHQYIESAVRGEIDDNLRLNKEFHHVIYSEAQMPILQQLIDILWHKISPYLHILLRKVEGYDITCDIKYHEGVLDGLKNSNAQEVCHWLRVDLEEAARVVRQYFNSIFLN